MATDEEAQKRIREKFDVAIRSESEQAITIYNEIINDYSDEPDVEIQELVANALFNRAVTLTGRGQIYDGLESYSEIVRRYSPNDSRVLRAEIAGALTNIGFEYGRQDRRDEAIESFRSAIRITEGEASSRLRVIWANAMSSYAHQLRIMGRDDEAMLVSSLLIDELTDDPDQAYDYAMGEALFDRSILFKGRQQYDDELADYERIKNRFDSFGSVAGEKYLLEAMYFAALSYTERGLSDSAIDAYDKWLSRAGQSVIDVESQYPIVLANKAMEMLRMLRVDEGIATLEELINRCGDSREAEARKYVSMARSSIKTLRK